MEAAEARLGDRGLALRPSGTKGGTRGVFTTRPMKRGTLVLESLPIGTVISPADRLNKCSYCFAPFRNLADAKRCTGCRQAIYCGKECQAADWRSGHRFVCNDDVLSSDVDVELLFRVSLIPLLAESDLPAGTLEAAAVFGTLEHHFDQLPAGMRHEYTRTAEAVREKLLSATAKLGADPALVASVADLARDLGRFGCNNFEMYDDEVFSYGLGVFPHGALLNHECRPNCVAVYVDSPGQPCVQQMRLTADVPADTELTVTYLDAIATDESRREATQQKYFFDCRCARCTTDDWIDGILQAPLLKACDGESARAIPAVMLWNKLLAQSRAPGRVGLELLPPAELCDLVHSTLRDPPAPPAHFAAWTAEQLCDKCSADLLTAHAEHDRALSMDDEGARVAPLRAAMRLQIETLHPLNRQHISLCNQLCDAMIAAGELDWRRLFFAAAHILLVYAVAYQPGHPLLGLQMFTAAKMAWNAGMKKEAEACLAEAHFILSQLHAKNAPILLNIRDMQRQVGSA